MSTSLRGGNAVWRLSVAYIGPNVTMSRTESPRKTKIGTEVAHITRDSDTTFKVKNVKGQGHQAALLTTALTSQAAAALSVGTYWPWEPNGTLRSALCRHGWLGSARRFGTHTGRRGAGHVVAAARLYSLLSFNCDYHCHASGVCSSMY